MTNTINQNPTLSPDTEQLAWAIAEAADDRKGEQILLLKVAEISYMADYFVLITGFSRTQVKAIASSIEQKLETVYQRYPIRVEGQAEGNWILQDYGDIIVHIFLPQERSYYNLEAFWGHAERIEFQPQKPLFSQK
jgi:ribosome-associated protein